VRRKVQVANDGVRKENPGREGSYLYHLFKRRREGRSVFDEKISDVRKKNNMHAEKGRETEKCRRSNCTEGGLSLRWRGGESDIAREIILNSIRGKQVPSQGGSLPRCDRKTGERKSPHGRKLSRKLHRAGDVKGGGERANGLRQGVTNIWGGRALYLYLKKEG